MQCEENKVKDMNKQMRDGDSTDIKGLPVDVTSVKEGKTNSDADESKQAKTVNDGISVFLRILSNYMVHLLAC